MRTRFLFPTSALTLSVLGLLACSSGGGSQPQPPTTTVTLNPSTATLAPGATQQFSATVANASNTSVTWTVTEGATGGSVNASGLYSAPATVSGASATFHVVATSVADGTKSATATVTVNMPTSVAINPPAATVVIGGTQQFTATVSNASNTAVTWAVQEGAAGGTVNTSGLYTAPAAISGASATFHVVATSVADSTKSAIAAIGVNSMPAILSFTATPAISSPGASVTLSWVVANTASLSINQGVGIVTGTSTTVNPLISTIYTLTASNANGSVNQSATVTVQTAAHNLSFLAGNLGGGGNLDGPGSAARFTQPNGVASDALGNAWVVDSSNHTIRKIWPDGTVSTVAGSSGQSGSTDGPASAARFFNPHNLLLDGAGNLYISDTSNHTIRKMSPGGVVTTIAGSPGQSGAADGNGAAARFKYPRGLALDAAGNLYVADFLNEAIRKVTPTGDVSTFAGSLGQSGFVDGSGVAARFSHPNGMTIDGSGNLFVTEYNNHTIRKITPTGVVSTFAGNGSGGSTDGTGSAARFLFPAGITLDPAGNLFVADAGDTIRKVTPAAQVTTLAGGYGIEGADDGQGSSARFYYPEGLAWDSFTGRILVADSYNMTIRAITPGGLVSTLAGSPPLSGSADGQGSLARFWLPVGVASNSTGAIFVAEMGNQTIRKVALDGTVSAFVGSPKQAGDADGTSTAARFRYPFGLAVDGAGNLLACEAAGHRIRKITPAGVVTTLAGSYSGRGSADGVGTAAQFYQPEFITLDAADNAYVTDNMNHTIRKITPAGVVSTVAGSAGQPGSAEGAGATARFNFPSGIAMDLAGNLYVADYANHTLRKITPDGTVSTLAGSAGQPGAADGTGSAARFNNPYAMVLDPVSGNLLVGDSGNSTIRLVTPSGVVSTLAGQAGKKGNLLGALPGVITPAASIARLPDGRFVFSTANGLILLNP
ncbi:MAG: hypothetical protein IPP78_08820 [Holophagaceae bacterium]|nr:hypothetical protein [Holophagaceae bacterium]